MIHTTSIAAAGIRAFQRAEDVNYTLGMTQKEVRKEWKASGKTWLDSIKIIGTCRYMQVIDPSLITFPAPKAGPRP